MSADPIGSRYPNSNVLRDEFECLLDGKKLKKLTNLARNDGEIKRFSCSEEDSQNPCYKFSVAMEKIQIKLNDKILAQKIKKQIKNKSPLTSHIYFKKCLEEEKNSETRQNLYNLWPIKNERLLQLEQGVLIPLKDDAELEVSALYKQLNLRAFADAKFGVNIIQMFFALERMVLKLGSDREYWDTIISLFTLLFDSTAIFVDEGRNIPVLAIFFDKSGKDSWGKKLLLDGKNDELIRFIGKMLKSHREKIRSHDKLQQFPTYMEFERTKERILLHLAVENTSQKKLEVRLGELIKSKKFFPYLQKLLEDAYLQVKSINRTMFPVFLIGPGNSYAFDMKMTKQIYKKLGKDDFRSLWTERFEYQGALSYASAMKLPQIIKNCWKDIRLLSYRSKVAKLEKKMIKLATRGQNPNKYKFLLNIPMLYHLERQNGESSGPIVTLTCFFQNDPKPLDKLRLYEIAYELQFAFMHVLNAEVEHMEKLRNSLRSFASTTMARTMAHNFSHVIRRHISTLDKPDTKQEKQLYNYILRRMVFIANITGGNALWSVSQPIAETLNPFKKKTGGVSLLRRYIAASEGYEEAYVLNIDNFERTLIALPWNGTGSHAIYSLFENHIRNLAKNSTPARRPKNIALNIEIEEHRNYPDLYKVTLWDNLSNKSQAAEVKRILATVQMINVRHKKALVDFLDDNGVPIRENLGFAEMLISAAFLRGIDIEHLFDMIDSPPLLEVRVVTRMEDINSRKVKVERMGLVLYLLKPKEMLVIDDEYSDKLTERDKKILTKLGVKVERLSWLEEHTSKASYRFVVINSADAKLENICPKLPSRVFLIKNQKTSEAQLMPSQYNEFKKLLQQKKLEAIKQATLLLYQAWINHLCPRVKYAFQFTEKKSNHADSVFKCISHKNTQAIVFHHHGYNNKAKALRIIGKERPRYYEAYGSGSAVGEILSSKNTPESEELFRLVESALSDIVIVDERLFDEFKNKPNDTKFLEAKGITVRGNQSNHYDIDLRNKKAVIREVNSSKKYRFLLLHKGVIDKIKKDLATDGNDPVKALVQRIHASKKFEQIIIHSDRGTAKGLPLGVKFMDYSTIADYVAPGEVLQNKHKFEFIEVLSCLMQ